MQVVVYLLSLGAVAAWVAAVVSALAIVNLAPKGTRFRTLFDIGWWRFGAIEQRAGAAVLIPVRRYRMAFLAFFACVLGGMAAGVAIISQSNTAS